jgi:hypothetical protein
MVHVTPRRFAYLASSNHPKIPVNIRNITSKPCITYLGAHNLDATHYHRITHVDDKVRNESRAASPAEL